MRLPRRNPPAAEPSTSHTQPGQPPDSREKYAAGKSVKHQRANAVGWFRYQRCEVRKRCKVIGRQRSTARSSAAAANPLTNPATEPNATQNVAPPKSTKSSPSRRLQYEICAYCGAVQLRTYDSSHWSYPTCWNCGNVFSEGAAPSESPSGESTASPSTALSGTSPSSSAAPAPGAEPRSLGWEPTFPASTGGSGPARIEAPSPPTNATVPATNALAEVDATLKKLDLGDIAFKVPERLPLREHATVILLLSPTQNAAQLKTILRRETAAGEKVESAERIQISGLMEAKLVGPAFAIRAITPEEPQLVSGKEPTEWKWDVTPKQPGQQSLHLTINAIVKYDGANRPRTVRSFDRTIQVEVPAGFSLVSGLAKQKWMIVALIALAIVALGFLSWRLSSRGFSKPPSTTAPAPACDQDLFVSYSRRDQKQVLALTKLLERRGFKIWIDQHRLDGASLWPKEVTEALLRAKVFVLVISKASIVSQNVIRELSLASEESKTILPLQLEQVEIPSSIRYQLAGIQYLVLNPRNPQENADQVIRTLSKLGVMQSQ